MKERSGNKPSILPSGTLLYMTNPGLMKSLTLPLRDFQTRRVGKKLLLSLCLTHEHHVLANLTLGTGWGRWSEMCVDEAEICVGTRTHVSGIDQPRQGIAVLSSFKRSSPETRSEWDLSNQHGPCVYIYVWAQFCKIDVEAVCLVHVGIQLLSWKVRAVSANPW